MQQRLYFVVSQVPVIGHDTIGQDPHRMFLGGFFEHPLERGVVLILFQQSQPRNGPIETW